MKKTDELRIRVSAADKAAILNAAQGLGVDISTWARIVLARASRAEHAINLRLETESGRAYPIRKRK